MKKLLLILLCLPFIGLGQNDCGKTTLMKIIMGTQELDNGILWSYPNLKISYFTQNFDINASKSVEEEIPSAVTVN